jgi:hypothetical protein
MAPATGFEPVAYWLLLRVNSFDHFLSVALPLSYAGIISL